MTQNKLLNAIEDNLAEIIDDFNAGRINEEILLSTLNEAVHYVHRGYIFEMLYIVALEREKQLPTSPVALMLLFSNLESEDQMYPDVNSTQFPSGGTRKEVLARLNLDATMSVYEAFLDGKATAQEVWDALRNEMDGKN